MAMARSFVPSPPDSSTLDLILSSQANNWNASQSLFEGSDIGHSKTHLFGGDGFYSHNDDQYEDRISQLQSHQSISQTVPLSQIPSLPLQMNERQPITGLALHSVQEIPERYRRVFSAFSTFNYVQSKAFNDVLYSDHPIVTSAPTGGGKTVLFELAIIRLLMKMGDDLTRVKIVYVAPIKALCAERYEDWNNKFGPLGLRCSELTGDSQLDDYFELQNAHIIMTTPEKWDSMTRKWRDNKSLVQMVQLFMIDEIHQLNDITRGPTMEAIVCRMKTVRASVVLRERISILNQPTDGFLLRFIAVSATVPNIEDVAIWLGTAEKPAITHCIDESHRPVQLRRIVLSYPNSSTDFKFDLSLNYKLSSVIQCYSDNKPTLVFCATRKGTQQAATILTKDARFVMNIEHKRRLQSVSATINDNKLRDLVSFGVGFHHAGMTVTDRKTIESVFYNGELPVLFATSTLAMGVNLPAHLVIIKSTMHYANSMFEEYSESQILQMIGRAGRPQFDTSATAVIMTRNSTRDRYEALLGGTQLVESNLHSHLIEHLNAEIVLQTITDVSIALDWLKSTFLFTRIRQNPKHYGIPEHVSVEELQEKLQEMCLQNLKELEAIGLLSMEDGFTLIATDTGKLMARYYVAFESMKRFLKLNNCDNISGLVEELSNCKEFEDVRLRMNEKRVLNQLNKDKHRQTIRYPMIGRIKSTDMKVNCLIQATLGCISIQEFSLNQDSQRIFRSASRLSKCLMEVQLLGSTFSSLLGSIILHKCITARLWENSHHVAKQLDKIGVTLSTTLVNARLTSFDKIIETNARELELIVNRHPPFGNQVKEAVNKLPKYSLDIEQSISISPNQADLSIIVSLVNHKLLNESANTAGTNHCCILVIGNDDNVTVLKQKINDTQLLSTGKWSRRIIIVRAKKGIELKVHLISLHYVGIDVQMTYTPRYYGYVKQPPENAIKKNPVIASNPNNHEPDNNSQKTKAKHPCNHRCSNKSVYPSFNNDLLFSCGHDCCKFGIEIRPKKVTSTPIYNIMSSTNKPIKNTKNDKMYYHLDKLHDKVQCLPSNSSVQRMKVVMDESEYSKYTLSTDEIKQFEYTPKRSMKPCSSYGNRNKTNHNPLLTQSTPSASSYLTTNDRCFTSNEFDNIGKDLSSFSETDWNQFEYSIDDNHCYDEEDGEWCELPPTPPPLPSSICPQLFEDSSVEALDDFESNDLFNYTIPTGMSTDNDSYCSNLPKRQCIRSDVFKRTPLAVLNQQNTLVRSPVSNKNTASMYNTPYNRYTTGSSNTAIKKSCSSNMMWSNSSIANNNNGIPNQPTSTTRQFCNNTTILNSSNSTQNQPTNSSNHDYNKPSSIYYQPKTKTINTCNNIMGVCSNEIIPGSSSINDYTSDYNTVSQQHNITSISQPFVNSQAFPQKPLSYKPNSTPLKEDLNRNKNIRNFFAVPTKAAAHHGQDQYHTTNSHLSSSEDDHDIYGTVFAGIF